MPERAPQVTRQLLATLAEALHYFGAHNSDSPQHAAWTALDEFMGPAEPYRCPAGYLGGGDPCCGQPDSCTKLGFLGRFDG